MSAVILPFGSRGIQPPARPDRFSLLGQVRRVCICKGCNGAQRALVVSAAEFWIDQRLTPDQVLKRARAKADELLNPPPGGHAA